MQSVEGFVTYESGPSKHFFRGLIAGGSRGGRGDVVEGLCNRLTYTTPNPCHNRVAPKPLGVRTEEPEHAFKVR